MDSKRQTEFEMVLTGIISRRGDWDVNDPDDPSHGKNWNASPEERPRQNGERTKHVVDPNPTREEKIQKKKSDFKESGYAQTDALTPGTPDYMEIRSSHLQSGAGIIGKMDDQDEDPPIADGSSNTVEPEGNTGNAQGGGKPLASHEPRLPENPRFGRFATDTGKAEVNTPKFTGTQDE